MNEEKQRIAIAESVGWKFVDNDPDYEPYWECPNGDKIATQFVAFRMRDYLNDLNAMQETVLTLPKELRHNYLGYLLETCETKKVGDLFFAYNASARQCAAAYLRTIGKWGH